MKSLKLTTLFCLFTLGMNAQPNYSTDRQQEKLERALIAFNTIDNTTFVIQGDTVKVTVPEASVIEVPQDQTPAGEQYFNLNGQPISSPDSVPVAIQVNTLASGQRVSRKVSVAH